MGLAGTEFFPGVPVLLVVVAEHLFLQDDEFLFGLFLGKFACLDSTPDLLFNGVKFRLTLTGTFLLIARVLL